MASMVSLVLMSVTFCYVNYDKLDKARLIENISCDCKTCVECDLSTYFD